jgi:secreted Zn-dependent insulinase-like peptidase
MAPPDGSSRISEKQREVSTALLGPDLNSSRSALDKKLYRQILLPNGLRCVLIQDTVAMNGSSAKRDYYDVDEEISEDDEEEEELSSKNGADSGSDDDDNSTSKKSDDKDDTGIREAAVAILVGAGAMYDPQSCQGLAHFLEHLLFMGSEKYPGENDYEAFVKKHGGQDNAFTEWEYTTYSLQIPQEFIWPALDRLAQFFICPLLLESAVDRELLAIESEFQLNKHSDDTRWRQLLCSTSRPDHPMAKFSWGNLKSLRDIPAKLGVDTLKELRTFFDRYYYAANMRLAIIGAYTLDEMEERVLKMFSPVPALPREQGPYAVPVEPSHIGSWKGAYASPIAIAGNPFKESTLGTIFRIVPVKDRHQLVLTWPIPPQMDHWKSKPCDFISHLLGHEASGSLLLHFRKQAWAISCMAGVGDEGSENSSSHAMFLMSFTLSENGVKEWKSVVKTVYEYIGMLRQCGRDGWPEWIYAEMHKINALGYHYRSEESPDEVVDGIVDDMAPHARLPPERILDGNSLLFDFDTEKVQNLLDNFLKPRNCRIDFMSSFFGRAADFEAAEVTRDGESTDTINYNLVVAKSAGEFDALTAGPPQVEPMFGVRFWCHALQEEWLDHLSDLVEPRPSVGDLSLPPQNPFVPVNLDLKPLPESDSRHTLLNCSLKLCIVVGKAKQWFPGLVLRYDRSTNAVLVSYEDEEERWHTLDDAPHVLVTERLTKDFEGTMDSRAIKYRVLSLALNGSHGKLIFDDESDIDVLEGRGFPAIPPPAKADRLPKSISDSNSLKMWWLQDRHFHRPIAELSMEIVCVKANTTPLHRACSELMVNLCYDALAETSYLADCCELGSSISTTDSGFTIRMHGFNDKLLELLRIILATVLSFRGRESTLPEAIQNDRFAACLEVLRRKYRNSDLSSAKLTSSIRQEVLRPTLWSANQKLKAVEGLDTNLFAQTISETMDKLAVECLFHGNVDRTDAEDAKKLILSMIAQSGTDSGLPRKQYPPQSVLRLPPVADASNAIVVPSKDPTEPNTAVEVYIQIRKDNIRERVLLDLLASMMEEPMYDQIRTKDQFGYDVSCDVRWSWGIMGIVFSIVTNVKSAKEAVERIDKFLVDFREASFVNDDSFNESLVALAQNKLEMFNSLSEECDSYWGEITDGRFEWQSWRNEAVCLRSIRKKDAMKFFDDWLMPGKCRNMMVVHVIGNGDSTAAAERPEVDPAVLGDFYEAAVEVARSSCKKQFWGRVNSRLF